LAVQAHNRGDDVRAIELLEAALRENPNLTMASAMLGDLYRANSDYRAAVEHYEAAARLDPYSPNAHYKVGLMYQLLDRLQEAAAAYLRALKLNPRDVSANMNLGLVYLALDQPDDAVYYTERATQFDPRSAAAWANFGVALDAAGEHARAEAAYRQSLDLDASQTATKLNLGTNLIAQKKADQAISVLQEVVRQDETALSRRRLGDALAMARQYDEAYREYRAALTINPQYYPALNELARVRIQQYRDGFELDDALRLSATEAWRQSLKINPRQRRIESHIQQWTDQTLFSSE
jgi:tetratricopeptide (TPR) repeat protein